MPEIVVNTKREQFICQAAKTFLEGYGHLVPTYDGFPAIVDNRNEWWTARAVALDDNFWNTLINLDNQFVTDVEDEKLSVYEVYIALVRLKQHGYVEAKNPHGNTLYFDRVVRDSRFKYVK